MYGIEGKNYRIVDGKVDFPANIARVYGWDGSEAFLNVNYCKSTNDEPFGSTEAYKEEVSKNTQYPTSTSLNLDKNKIQGILDTRKDDYQKMERKILHEDINVKKEIDAFINEQKSIGIDKVLDSYQKQINEWKAKFNQ